MISRPWRLSWKLLQARIWRDRSRDSTLPGHRRQRWLSTKAINTICWWRRKLCSRWQTHLLLGWWWQPWALESCWMPRRHAGARSSARTWARNCVRWVQGDSLPNTCQRYSSFAQYISIAYWQYRIPYWQCCLVGTLCVCSHDKSWFKSQLTHSFYFFWCYLQ